MANAVNSGFAKCFIFFMAVVILVQGVVYLGLSIWGFTLRTCKDQPTDIQAKPFQFAIDLIYFTDESCGNPKVTISTTTPIEQQQDYELDVVDWVKSFMVTNRFFIFLITYTVISALWIVTSFLVLATMCGRLTKVVSAVIYWPWFLVVIAGSILDAVATGYFIKDIVNTTSADEMFTYIGIEVNDPNVMSVLKTFDPYFVTPSIIMTCISSRVVIIWLLNIFGCSFCLSMSTLLAKSNSAAKVKNTSAQPAAQQAPNYYGANLTQPQQQQQPQQAQMQERKYEQTPRQLSYIEPVPVPMQQQQQRQQPPQRQQSTPQPQSPQVTENIMVEAQIMASAPPANDVNQNNRASMGPAVNTTYRSTDAHPDRLDYPRSSTPEVRVLTPQPQFAVESPLNTRYSDAFQFQQQQQPQRVSDELRSQLPWSYTSMLAKPQVPRKPTAYPDIPEADYNDAPAAQQPVIQSNNDGTAYSRW